MLLHLSDVGIGFCNTLSLYIDVKNSMEWGGTISILKMYSNGQFCIIMEISFWKFYNLLIHIKNLTLVLKTFLIIQ